MLYTDAVQRLSTQTARLMNVPAYLLSSENNQSMTYSNIQDERKQFLAQSLQPFISAIESRLSMDDISTVGHEVKFDIDSNYLRTEPLVELQVIEKMLQLELITLDQAKGMTDMTPNGNDGN
jgi:phage portal protein BeeE